MEHDTYPRLGDHPFLHDHVALDEIELYAEVLIAVADAEHPLSTEEIDRVLGLSSMDEDAAPGSDPDRLPGPTRTGGTDSCVPERAGRTRSPEPCEEESRIRVLPDTGPLFSQARVLPEAMPLSDMLPPPLGVLLSVAGPSTPPLVGWPF